MRELALRSNLEGAIHIFDAEDGSVCSLGARKHSIACASAAHDIAVSIGREEPEVAYAAGLLATIGSLALWDLFESTLQDLRKQLVGADVQAVIETERLELGVDHESLGVVIAEGWGLPFELQDVLTGLHRTPQQLARLAEAGADSELATLVRTGSFLAHAAGFPLFTGLSLGDTPEDVAEMLEQVDSERILERARAAVSAAAEVSRPVARSMDQGFEIMRRSQTELRERLVRAERQLRAEESVNSVLQYGLSRLGDGDPLPGVMYRAMEAMGFHRIACLEADSRSSKLEVIASAASSGHTRPNEGIWVPFDCGRADLSVPRILTLEDGDASHRLALELLGVSAAAIAPLRGPSTDKHLYLAVDRGRVGRAPSTGEERCLGIIADQLSLLLQYEQLTKEKERMAMLDPLTGAATRRRLMDRLEYTMTQSKRTKMPFTLLIMDLDHFKKFNDTMGHQVGDKLLQDLVAVLSQHVRKGDLVARYGGEEFVVLLPNCSLPSALRVAEDLRNEVYDYGLKNRESYRGLPVSVSMGAAQWNGEESSLKLIGRADEALYDSKHNGRNRVTPARSAA